MTIAGILGIILIIAIGWLALHADYTQSARARRRDLDRLARRESAMAAWARMINEQRKF